MGKKDKGVLVYFSPKNRKKVKALIRELGLEFVLVEKTNEAQTLTLKNQSNREPRYRGSFICTSDLTA